MPGQGNRRERDLYEVLEVSPRATPDVIRAAFRVLARRYHPDVSGSEPGCANDGGLRMRQLNAAYKVLMDAERRARYDQHRARSSPRSHAVVQAHPSGVPKATVRSASPVPGFEPGRAAKSIRRMAVAVIFILSMVMVITLALWVVYDFSDEQPTSYGFKMNRTVIDSPPPIPRIP